MPSVCQRRDIKARVVKAAAPNIIVGPEALLIRVDDDLVISTLTASQRVPALGLRDRGLKVAVHGPLMS